MLSEAHFIYPDWPAPSHVKALQTTRLGGFSQGDFAELNLAAHVGDDPITVNRNRQLLAPWLPSEPVWLNQVHGVTVVDAGVASCVSDADASYSNKKGAVCAVMTADCLPLLVCDQSGTEVAAIHAGWKGLLDGVIESTIQTMQSAPESLLVWMGPAIGPTAFEVGTEVKSAFIDQQMEAEAAFVPNPNDKWLGDLYLLARLRLQRLGVKYIHGGELCTYSDNQRFFSYRRDGVTGRMATLIWLE